MRIRPDARRDRGQVLPLFALFLIALLAFAALAVDVSGAYSARRFYRSAADAASLAGAQDLQSTGSRAVTSADRIRARGDAMKSLTTELGITGGLPAACSTAADVDVTDACALPGTSFHVSIKAGTATGPNRIMCQVCDPARSVQVGLRNATYQLSFARVLGQSTWNVGVISVAGLAFGKAYAVETLRPPKQAGNTFNVNDIVLNSNNTVVNVSSGDVGTNANMDYSGTGTVLNIDPGYGMFYYDPYSAPQWYPSPPAPPTQIVEQLPTLIQDPNYRYPDMTLAPTFDDARASEYLTLPAVQRADVSATCAAEAAKLDTSRYTFMATQPLDKIYCYNPGTYTSGSGVKNAQINIGTGDVGILKPGAYYLRSGLDVGGRLVGGYQAGSPGVALMLDETGPGNCSSCIFKGNNALTIALNAGTKFPRGNPGSGATAAVDWAGQLVQTSGPDGPKPPVLMTLLVRKDANCFVPTSAPFIEPSGCQDSKNQTVNIAGGGQIDIEGVQYAPTDNFAIAGSSDGNGTIGEIVAWTLTYSGSTTLNQQGSGSQGPGTLRLDAACTAPGTPCNP
ncbi:MAG: pilus assembly protein TadG-related protein [Chloroflexota bacterium]